MYIQISFTEVTIKLNFNVAKITILEQQVKIKLGQSFIN